jgi:hypothetical protein
MSAEFVIFNVNKPYMDTKKVYSKKEFVDIKKNYGKTNSINLLGLDDIKDLDCDTITKNSVKIKCIIPKFDTNKIAKELCKAYKKKYYTKKKYNIVIVYVDQYGEVVGSNSNMRVYDYSFNGSDGIYFAEEENVSNTIKIPTKLLYNFIIDKEEDYYAIGITVKKIQQVQLDIPQSEYYKYIPCKINGCTDKKYRVKALEPFGLPKDFLDDWEDNRSVFGANWDLNEYIYDNEYYDDYYGDENEE